MMRSKVLLSCFVVLAVIVLAANEASAQFSYYCGNGTQYWNSGGFAYKAVYDGEGPPNGGTQQKLYDIYKASQVTGWSKIVNDESHTCPY